MFVRQVLKTSCYEIENFTNKFSVQLYEKVFELSNTYQYLNQVNGTIIFRENAMVYTKRPDM